MSSVKPDADETAALQAEMKALIKEHGVPKVGADGKLPAWCYENPRVKFIFNRLWELNQTINLWPAVREDV